MDRLPGSEKENPWSKPQNARGALGIGCLAAVLASICCVGPLVLVSIGISGAWIGNLTVFEPYRPIFTGAALVALFFAYRRIFRPAQAWGGLCRTASQDGVQEHLLDRGRTDGGRACVPLHSAAVLLKGQRMKKLITVLALSAALSAPAWAATQTVTLSVTGMTCATCPITIKKALNKVEGVENIEVNLEKKEALVTFDDARTTVEALLEATKNAGYPSTVHP